MSLIKDSRVMPSKEVPGAKVERAFILGKVREVSAARISCPSIPAGPLFLQAPWGV